MSSVQYQLNYRYALEMQHKTQEYFGVTKHIRKARTHLRNIYLPKMLMKEGMLERIYPDEFYRRDTELRRLQSQIWDVIFEAEEK